MAEAGSGGRVDLDTAKHFMVSISTNKTLSKMDVRTIQVVFVRVGYNQVFDTYLIRGK